MRALVPVIVGMLFAVEMRVVDWANGEFVVDGGARVGRLEKAADAWGCFPG